MDRWTMFPSVTTTENALHWMHQNVLSTTFPVFWLPLQLPLPLPVFYITVAIETRPSTFSRLVGHPSE